MNRYYIQCMAYLIVCSTFINARIPTTALRVNNFVQTLIQQDADFLIAQSDIPKTISTSGVYRLIEPITIGTGATGFTISADDVTLDLNGKKISGGATGVSISTNRNNVAIQNGLISGCTSIGIDVASGCSNVTVQDMQLRNIGTGIAGVGLRLTGVTNSNIRRCLITGTAGTGLSALSSCQRLIIENCTVNSSLLNGILMNQCSRCTITGCTLASNKEEGLLMTNGSQNIVVESCSALDNTNTGFSLINTNTVFMSQCRSIGNSRSTNVAGFSAQSGYGNIFDSCVANGMVTTSTNAGDFAAGFTFLGTEQCSQITNCEIGNITTPPGGLSVPYGIFIQPTIDTIVTVTQNQFSGTGNHFCWLTDPSFLILGYNTFSGETTTLKLYEFNRFNLGQNNLTALIDRQTILPGGGNQNIISGASTNDNNLLATGGAGGSLNVWAFNTTNKKLSKTLVAVEIGATIYSVAWSPDNRFLVAVTDPTGGNNTHIYQYNNPPNASLTLVRRIPGSSSPDAVSFSPDGNYIVVGGSSSNNTTVTLFEFDQNNGVFNVIERDTEAIGSTIHSFSWTFDGNYLAVGSAAGLNIYSFNKTTKLLTAVSSVGSIGDIQSVSWSPDGKFIVTGGNVASSATTRVFSFSRNTSSVNPTPLGTFNHGNGTFSVDWSRDGRYIAIAGFTVSGTDMRILNGLQFPSKNVISDNIIDNIVGNSFMTGIGIAGSAIENAIVRNIVHRSDFGYQFVPAVYDLIPSNTSLATLQNISAYSGIAIDYC